MAKPRAFISHSSKDKPFVRKLKEDLNFNDIDTWVDEDELKVGDKLYETLILGLQSSSHFLIVLSDNIKGSDWVDKEINEAISAIDKKLLKKIIPVVLRKTEIPEVFSKLFRADFSSIIFTINGDKVSFTGNEYNTEFTKIVNAIKQSNDYLLSEKEKTSIVDETEKKQHVIKPVKAVGLYQIIGFKDNTSRAAFVTKMKSKFKDSALAKMQTNKIIPVILPSLVKPLFDPKLKLGDTLYFETGLADVPHFIGHFCGFAASNQKIVIAGEIRKLFDIKSKDALEVEFNGKTRTITFYEKE